MNNNNSFAQRLENRLRIYDQMLSMHSFLCCKYSFWSKFLDGLTLSSSALILAFTFSDVNAFNSIGIPGSSFKYIIGISTIAIFCLTLISMIIDLKSKSSNHAHARRVLSEIKAELVTILQAEQSAQDNEVKVFLAKADVSLSGLLPIPDKQFNSLKSYHLKKIALSRFLSKNPTLPIVVCKIVLFWKGMKNVCNHERGRGDE